MTQPAPYKVKLEDIFEGPMDLLVHLAKKNELDVTNIPIALITDQYLEYLEFLRSINIDVAAEFLVMAATLIQLKSRMLLPTHDGEEDDEELSCQLTRPLQEYLEMKSAAEQLAERHLLGKDTFTRPPVSGDLQFVEEDTEVIAVGLFELIDAFKRILENMSAEHRVDITTSHLSIKDRISEIVSLLEEKGSATFGELFTADCTRAQVIVTFLAILEMVKLRLMRMVQHVPSGVIRLFYQ